MSKVEADREDLAGVMVEKPKYPNYTAREARIESFKQWPRHLTQSVDEMTSAGFFFTGIEDHCRCFYCGGGLKNWEKDDRPATEHARWYPNCAFILHQNNSASLLTASVQTNEVKKQQNHIGNTHIESTSNDFMNHSAVKSVLEFGFAKSVIKNAYESLQQSSRDISATDLLTVILDLEDKENGHHSTTSVERKPESIPENKINKTTDQHLQESIRCLEEENQNLRDQQTCKICLDEPVAIVFLPCGHMASCINCAPALRLCPICRAFIKGTVKAIMF